MPVSHPSQRSQISAKHVIIEIMSKNTQRPHPLRQHPAHSHSSARTHPLAQLYASQHAAITVNEDTHDGSPESNPSSPQTTDMTAGSVAHAILLALSVLGPAAACHPHPSPLRNSHRRPAVSYRGMQSSHATLFFASMLAPMSMR